MDRLNTRFFNSNKFKLGLFAMNCSNGLTMTKAPERWDASWENNVAAARLADEAGIEFLLPIGRWHGYKGETDTEGSTFETLTWAAGLLASTRNICVSGTLHVAFMSPVFASKQMVTADLIGRGRFALNIVSGWNAGEFGMFGTMLMEHDRRYDYTAEWVHVVKRIWSEDKPFDHDGDFFKLKNVLLKPKPAGGSHPLLISAGNSDKGRDFAVNNVDCLFIAIQDVNTLAERVAGIRAIPKASPYPVGIYASGHTIFRRTRKEAEEFYHYIVDEHGDWEAAEHAARIRLENRADRVTDIQAFKRRLISGVGTYPVLGDYDDVAQQFKNLSDAGLDGMAVGLVNYVTEFPAFRDEILPRMERLGLREPYKTSQFEAAAE